jgi:Flp pilus assembly protein TadD
MLSSLAFASKLRNGGDSTATRSSAALLAIAAVVAFWAYWPALTGGFIWDDDALLTLNPLVKAADGLYRIWFTTDAIDYWPVTNSSFWLEWRMWGTRAAGYHVTNLLLHLCSALLFWRILRQLSVPGALLAALLFALHPVNVESVAWIAERKNTLAMVFFLLAILWFLRVPSAEGRAPKWYWLSLAAFVLAMLSKGSVALLPAMLLVIIWWRRGTVTRADLLRTAPFFAVSVALTLVNVWFQTHRLTSAIRDVTPIERLLGAAAVVWFYLYKALLPIKLIFIYPEWVIRAGDARWWLPLAAAIAVTALLIRQRKRPVARALLCAWLFFGLALVPVMGLVDVYFMKYSLVADHYQYIAILAVTACVAAGLSRLAARVPANAFRAGCGVLLLLLATATWRQAHLYANAETLYRTTLSRNPSAWMAHNNLGLFLLKKSPSDFQEGFTHLQTALSIKPGEAALHNNVGIALFQMDRFQEAVERHREAVRLDASYADAYGNLGADYQQLGRHAEAVDAFRRALQINPELTFLRSNLTISLQALGRSGEANEEMQQASQRVPATPQEHGGAGDALLRLGRTNEAIAQYEAALRLDPGSAHIMNNLGYALMVAGRLTEAERHLRQAARLRQGDSAIHDNLGNVLQQMNRLDEAVAEFQVALRSSKGGDLAEIHNDLGIALARLGRRDDAIAHFREAVRLKPDLATARANLAKALGVR